jgi:hypothetical protein
MQDFFKSTQFAYQIEVSSSSSSSSSSSNSMVQPSWCGAQLKKSTEGTLPLPYLIVIQLSRIFPCFVEPTGSKQYSQETAI